MTAPPDTSYVALPNVELCQFARRPLALGALIAVIRLCMRAAGPVPASRADLVAWANDCATRDGGLGTRLKRAVDDLRSTGLLVGTAEPGAKLWLQPGWGLGHDGQARPWNWERRDRGRPRGVGFKQIPLGLLDNYLGVCHPDDHDPAQIERWFDLPLLDLADLGAYALRCAGIRVAPAALARLRHLGLLDERDQPLPPRPRAELLERAAAGELTTLSNDGQVVTVALSPLGQHALARREAGALKGSPSSCAAGWSFRGSFGWSQETNDDPAPPCAETLTEAAPTAAWERIQRVTKFNHPPQPDTHMAEEVVVLLDPMLQIGHRLINSDREIPATEWLGLLALQQECGVNRILTWQARAAEAGRTQVVPAYYRQCAAAAAFGAVQPTPPPAQSAGAETEAPISVPTPLAPPAPARPALDADQQVALRELEQAAGESVRAPWRLAGTPAGCIRAWAGCIVHPGLVAYCRLPPLHYAVDQMALCLLPPSTAQLARWAAAVAPGVTGERWSDATITELVAAGGGLFTLGSETDDLAVWPGSGASTVPPAGASQAAPTVAPADPPRAASIVPPAGAFRAGGVPGAPGGGAAPNALPASPARATPSLPAARNERPPAAPSAAPAAGPARTAPNMPADRNERPPAAPPAVPPVLSGGSGGPLLALLDQGFESPPGAQDPEQRRWSCALGVLQQELPRHQFNAWVRGARWGGLSGDVATIVAGRPDQVDGLRRLAPELERALVGVLGQPVTVVVQSDGYVERENPAPHPPAQPAPPPPAVQPVPPGPPGPAAPSWVAPAAWASLPPTLRVALAGARLEGGQVVAPSPLFQRVIERHAEQVQALLDGAGGGA